MSAFQSFDQCFLSAYSASGKEGLPLKESAFLDPQAEGKLQGGKIECIREGDLIRGIRVVCGCGQELYLECEYTKHKP